MTTHRTNLANAFLVLATISVVGCGGNDTTAPGTGTSTDRSGTWTLTGTATNPCPGDDLINSFSVNLVQSGRTLTGTRCLVENEGQLETWTFSLSGANNTSFSGTVSGCDSVNRNCQAPFDPQRCFSTVVQGTISGNGVSGTYTNDDPQGCSDGGTFTGTIS